MLSSSWESFLYLETGSSQETPPLFPGSFFFLISSPFFFSFCFLINSWFTLLCQFLLYNKVTQSYIHSFSHIIFHNGQSQKIDLYSRTSLLIHSKCNSLVPFLGCIWRTITASRYKHEHISFSSPFCHGCFRFYSIHSIFPTGYQILWQHSSQSVKTCLSFHSEGW